MGLPVLPAAERRQRVLDTVAFLRAVWARQPGFESMVVPNPLPPIIVAANGPKMAAVAGRCADAVNFHDWQPDLPGAVAAAVAAAQEAGNGGFEVTLEVPFEEAWLRPDSKERQEVAAVGVSRVMVRWSAAVGVDAIQRAAEWTETA